MKQLEFDFYKYPPVGAFVSVFKPYSTWTPSSGSSIRGIFLGRVDNNGLHWAGRVVCENGSVETVHMNNIAEIT